MSAQPATVEKNLCFRIEYYFHSAQFKVLTQKYHIYESKNWQNMGLSIQRFKIYVIRNLRVEEMVKNNKKNVHKNLVFFSLMNVLHERKRKLEGREK